MPSPHQLRRAWPVVVAVLLAIQAYFVGSGVSALVGSSLIATPAGATRDASGGEHPREPERPSAQPILARNPFDSVTGPLLPKAGGESQARRPPRVVDPLAAPKCSGVRVDATTESTDPRWSMAVLQGPKDKHGRVRRVGHEVAGKLVAYIGFNPRERSPAVWLTGDEGLCQSLLFDEDKQPAVKPKPKPKPRKPPRRRVRTPPALPKNVSDKIRSISATEYDVDRSVVDVVMRDYSKLMRGVVVKPVLEKGRVVGLRLSRSTPQSLLGRLGLKNGDIIKSINGFALTSPDKALQAYARLRTADDLDLEIVRGGKATTIDVHVK